MKRPAAAPAMGTAVTTTRRPAAAPAKSEAAAAAARAAKAPKLEEVAKTSKPVVVGGKFASIVEVLRLAEGVPQLVVDMLVSALDLIEDVLNSQVSAAQGRVDAADAVLLAARKECEAKQQALAATAAMADAADTQLAEKRAHLATTLEALAKAQGTQAQDEAARAREARAVEAVSTSQARLQAIQEKHDVLLTGSPEPSREIVANQVLDGLKGFVCGDSLLASLPAVLAREPGACGDFDKLVLAQLASEFKRIADELAEKFRAATDECERSNQAAQASTAEAQRLRELVQSAAVDVESAESEVGRQAEARSMAQGALADAETKANGAHGELSVMTGKLEALQSGPVQSFRAVREMRIAPPSAGAADGGCGGAPGDLGAPADHALAEESTAEVGGTVPTTHASQRPELSDAADVKLGAKDAISAPVCDKAAAEASAAAPHVEQLACGGNLAQTPAAEDVAQEADAEGPSSGTTQAPGHE